MLDNVFGFFEKLVLDFTWTRFTFFLSILLLFILSIVTFELYTNHFYLNRLEREAKVLDQLVDTAKKIQEIPITDSERAAFVRIQQRIDQAISQPTLKIGTLPVISSKAVYTALPWVFLSLLVLLTNTSGRGSALAGMAVFATPVLLLGVNLPTFQAEWINKFAYPWGSMIFVVIMVLYVQRRRTS